MNYELTKALILAGIRAGRLNLQEYGAGPVSNQDGESFHAELTEPASDLYQAVEYDYIDAACTIYCSAFNLACEGTI